MKYIVENKFFSGRKLYLVGTIFDDEMDTPPRNKEGKIIHLRSLGGLAPKEPEKGNSVTENIEVPKSQPITKTFKCKFCGESLPNTRALGKHKKVCEKNPANKKE